MYSVTHNFHCIWVIFILWLFTQLYFIMYIKEWNCFFSKFTSIIDALYFNIH